MPSRKKKKYRKHNVPVQKLDPKIPRSMVLRRGTVGVSIRKLEVDLREVMQPHTAVRLQERKSNNLKDFLNVATEFAVRNLLVLTATEHASYLRILRTPRGPSVTFRLASYSLVRDVARAMKRPALRTSEFLTPPLLVMNNFGQEAHFKLVATLLNGLFPAINVHTTKLSQCRRVLLIDYDAKDEVFKWRHYEIIVRPVGISRAVKKAVVSSRRIPALSHLQDVADYLLGGGDASDSEGSEAVEEKVALPEKYPGRGNLAAKKSAHKSAIRMREIGPRMDMKLIKIVEGVASGGVLYHTLVSKTPAEVAAAKAERQRKKVEKKQRREQQEANVRRKKLAKGERVDEEPLEESSDEDSLAEVELEEEDDFENAFSGAQEVIEAYDDGKADRVGDGGEEDDDDDDDDDALDSNDDAYWYEEAVGQKPSKDEMPQEHQKKRKKDEKKSSEPWFKQRRKRKKNGAPKEKKKY